MKDVAMQLLELLDEYDQLYPVCGTCGRYEASKGEEEVICDCVSES